MILIDGRRIRHDLGPGGSGIHGPIRAIDGFTVESPPQLLRCPVVGCNKPMPYSSLACSPEHKQAFWGKQRVG